MVKIDSYNSNVVNDAGSRSWQYGTFVTVEAEGEDGCDVGMNGGCDERM